ncbi:MAG: low molecular weight phosphotyrosine protein phosphatase [Lachnospiraceae bacterium]|nr:low molecular weight phosphotyrosine protein phosphatase [Candidatus Equihabitans merdae]
MIKVLFVCHGNICRSTMSEQVFKDMVAKEGLSDCFEIDSAATSREEIGNTIYPPAKKTLIKYGIDPGNHRARQITKRDYEHFDYIFIMDHYNARNLERLLGPDKDNKVRMLHTHAISDPWYSGDFESTYWDVVEGCSAFLEELKNTNQI